MESERETYAIIGAAMEVHRELGPGHLEAVYHEALEIEFDLRRITYASEPQLLLRYKSHKLKRRYQPDFVAFADIVIEIKAQACLTKVDHAQILNSLKASGHRIGLLINFGEASLKWKRFIVGNRKKEIQSV